MSGAVWCLQMVVVWGDMCSARLLTKQTGLSSGLCQCRGSDSAGLLLGLVIKGLAVVAEVALISCVACWKYAVCTLLGVSKYLILDVGYWSRLWADTLVCK